MVTMILTDCHSQLQGSVCICCTSPTVFCIRQVLVSLSISLPFYTD
jgi:hypothetical protein